MKLRFLIGAVANRPSPVRERPTRNGFLRERRLRGMGGGMLRWRPRASGDVRGRCLWMTLAETAIFFQPMASSSLPARLGGYSFFPLRQVHDHPRRQVEPRLDRIDIDIL